MIKARASDEISVPEDLEQRVRNYLDKNPEEPWSSAVRHFVAQMERSKAMADKKCRPRKGGCS
jgi:hypothetical protein